MGSTIRLPYTSGSKLLLPHHNGCMSFANYRAQNLKFPNIGNWYRNHENKYKSLLAYLLKNSSLSLQVGFTEVISRWSWRSEFLIHSNKSVIRLSTASALWNDLDRWPKNWIWPQEVTKFEMSIVFLKMALVLYRQTYWLLESKYTGGLLQL